MTETIERQKEWNQTLSETIEGLKTKKESLKKSEVNEIHEQCVCSSSCVCIVATVRN